MPDFMSRRKSKIKTTMSLGSVRWGKMGSMLYVEGEGGSINDVRVWDLGAKMGGIFAHGGELSGEGKQKGGDLMCVVRCVLKNQSKRCDVFRERIGVEKLEMMFTCGTGVLSKEKNKLCAWSAVQTWTGTKKTLTEQNVRHGGDQINIQSFHVC